jgi:hypothetical protein
MVADRGKCELRSFQEFIPPPGTPGYSLAKQNRDFTIMSSKTLKSRKRG